MSNFLTVATVQAVINCALSEAKRNGWDVTVAVTDPGGHLLGLQRADNAAPISAMIAPEKARTAAISGKPSKVFEDMINNGRTAFLSVSTITALEGGLPILIEGRLLGGVGVSGAKPDQDVQVALAGINGAFTSTSR